MPSAPLFLFAPGAGAPSAHPWMRHWAQLLQEIGPTRTLDYRYMMEGRKRPDPLPMLVEAHLEALVRARESHAGPLVLIGKSMGSRIGCYVSLKHTVSGLVCLGYPLCGAGDRSKLRDAILRELTTPILFVQGTRDSLCPLDLLEQVRPRMRAANELSLVEEGDHSLRVTKTWLKLHGATQEQIDRRILADIKRFVTSLGD